MFQRILVTLDGSLLARAALAQAEKLAVGAPTEVLVVEVIETMDALRRDAVGQYEFTDGEPARIEALAQEMHFNKRQRALDELDEARKRLTAAGVSSVRTEVVEGLAGNEIIDCAEREHCDAILMATRGYGGLGREVIGSVAEYVLRHTQDAAVILVGTRTTEVSGVSRALDARAGTPAVHAG